MAIYEKATEFSEVKDSAYVSKSYREMAVKLANLLAQVNEMKGSAEYLTDITHDNGDPVFELTEAVEKLGIALASCVTYAKEYANEAEGKESED